MAFTHLHVYIETNATVSTVWRWYQCERHISICSNTVHVSVDFSAIFVQCWTNCKIKTERVLTQEQITQQALQSGLLITKHVTATLLSRIRSIQTDTLIAAKHEVISGGK